MSTPSDSEGVLPGHVRLILVLEPLFYLEVPLSVIDSLCLRPRKYLVFIGWCILGVKGDLHVYGDDEVMDLDGPLNNQSVYYYGTPGESTDLSKAVDLEVIKQRTCVYSATMDTRYEFRDALLKRDFCCMWTGIDEEDGEGIHIIPYTTGSEWLQLVVANRSRDEEQTEEINDINDIRNGMFTSNAINKAFDRRSLAVLKTPNPILAMTDIPERSKRLVNIPEEVIMPRDMRYTLQWLEEPNQTKLVYVCRHNFDAAFKKRTREPKPSDLLVHYHYGAAAVTRWGHGMEVLQSRPNLPRPPTPPSVPMSPPKIRYDRADTIAKREKFNRAAAAGAGNVATREASRSGEMLDSEGKGQARWDADDVVLYLRGNSRAATERYRKMQETSVRNMEQWRQEVPSLSK